MALIIALAWYCERFPAADANSVSEEWLFRACSFGLVLALIFKEPDVGNMLLLATVSGVVLLIGGIRLRYFLPPVIAGALAVGLVHLP